MRQILGIKRGMTTLFMENGDMVGVTVIEAGPCPVIQVKTKDRDGYEAVQVGLGDIRKSLVNKPRTGQFKDRAPMRYLRELRLTNAAEMKVGDMVTVDQFKAGEQVDVIGITRGMGFQGVVKRHKFGGGPVTHGQSDRTRAPGSVGASSYPSRTFRGQRMGGRMGTARVTETNLKVAEVRPEENLIFVRGAVPGKKNSLVVIRQSRKSRVS